MTSKGGAVWGEDGGREKREKRKEPLLSVGLFLPPPQCGNVTNLAQNKTCCKFVSLFIYKATLLITIYTCWRVLVTRGPPKKTTFIVLSSCLSPSSNESPFGEFVGDNEFVFLSDPFDDGPSFLPFFVVSDSESL